MRTTYIYRKPEEKCKLNEGKPLLLFVTVDKSEYGPNEITIHGSENPLPFKQVIVKRYATDFEKWLLEKGWIRTGHYDE